MGRFDVGETVTPDAVGSRSVECDDEKAQVARTHTLRKLAESKAGRRGDDRCGEKSQADNDRASEPRKYGRQ